MFNNNGCLTDGPFLFLIYFCLINMQMCCKPHVIKCGLHLLVCFKSINFNIDKNIIIFSAQKGSGREESYCIHAAVCTRNVPGDSSPPPRTSSSSVHPEHRRSLLVSEVRSPGGAQRCTCLEPRRYRLGRGCFITQMLKLDAFLKLRSQRTIDKINMMRNWKV